MVSSLQQQHQRERPKRKRPKQQLTPRKSTAKKNKQKPLPITKPPPISLKLIFSPANPASARTSSPPTLAQQSATECYGKQQLDKVAKVASSSIQDDKDLALWTPSAKRASSHHTAKQKKKKEESSAICPADSENSSLLKRPQRCFKCKKIGLPESSLRCSKCALCWHIDCLDFPLTFRPALWVCPLHILPQSHTRKLQTHTAPFRLLPAAVVDKSPVVNQTGGFAGLLNLLKEKRALTPQLMRPAGIKVPEAVLAHYNHALGMI